jgi:antitoxin ParD1/3/4
MHSLQVELPPSTVEFIREQIASGRFDSPSAYFHALIDADQQRESWDRLEALVAEGLAAGSPVPATPEFWEAKRRRLRERFEKAASA